MDQKIINIQVIKHSGEKALFDVEKLKSALIRSGARPDEIDQVISEISKKLYQGISTRKIYQIAYAVLRKRSHNAAGRYRLKKAVLDLGPSGYPFEKFVGRLMAFKGYEVEVSKIIQGKCVTHEVDVIAKKDLEHLYIECKFHQDRGKNDVKIPMYIKSRFDDIRNNLGQLKENKDVVIKGMLITNTRFTTDAQDFGKCSGLTLIGWDYPHHHNLRDWIDQAGFHPITSLSSLNKKMAQALLERDVILCCEVEKKKDVLVGLGLRPNEIRKIIKEANEVMKYQVK
ncbi:MAG: ATPase [Bacteroidales bacterium]|nr:ATPase [Bacteroidales bacterium]